jgi:uncharacterized protein
MIPKFRFMIFFLVILTVTILVNLYIYYRTRPLFPAGNPGRWLSVILFWLIALSYFIGRFIERTGYNWLSEPFIKAGSLWLGAMVYLILLFLLADILRGVSLIPGLKGFFSFPWLGEKGKMVSFIMYIITAVVLIAGFFNARYPAVVRQPIKLDKPLPGGRLKAVLASDIHLGTLIASGRLKHLVDLINRQDPDVILLGGDIFDEDLGPVIRNNLGDLLKNLKAGQGVIAILGNHEFYANAAEAQRYLENHNITVLRDSVMVLPGGTTIAGREDITGQQMFHKKRKSLTELLTGVDTLKPVILMDHQPSHVEDVASFPVDLQVSGHTHHGQLWPFNYITGAIYRFSKGYGTIGKTHFYVSPGVGTWGPPIRTSCRPEIIVLEITGSK